MRKVSWICFADKNQATSVLTEENQRSSPNLNSRNFTLRDLVKKKKNPDTTLITNQLKQTTSNLEGPSRNVNILDKAIINTDKLVDKVPNPEVKSFGGSKRMNTKPQIPTKPQYFKKFKDSYSKVNEIKMVSVELASPARIKQWAERTLPGGKIVGEVKNAETLHYKTFKPIKGGLFCERIFGPTKDHECACGKKFNIKTYLSAKPVSETTKADKSAKDYFASQLELNNKRYFCSTCYVEYTYSTIRRTQLGYIQLATPVTHIWFVKGVPNYMSILLDMKKRDLQHVIYNFGVLTLENSLKGKQLVTIRPADLYETWAKVAKVGLKKSSNTINNLLAEPRHEAGSTENSSREKSINSEVLTAIDSCSYIERSLRYKQNKRMSETDNPGVKYYQTTKGVQRLGNYATLNNLYESKSNQLDLNTLTSASKITKNYQTTRIGSPITLSPQRKNGWYNLIRFFKQNSSKNLGFRTNSNDDNLTVKPQNNSNLFSMGNSKPVEQYATNSFEQPHLTLEYFAFDAASPILRSGNMLNLNKMNDRNKTNTKSTKLKSILSLKAPLYRLGFRNQHSIDSNLEWQLVQRIYSPLKSRYSPDSPDASPKGLPSEHPVQDDVGFAVLKPLPLVFLSGKPVEPSYLATIEDTPRSASSFPGERIYALRACIPKSGIKDSRNSRAAALRAKQFYFRGLPAKQNSIKLLPETLITNKSQKSLIEIISEIASNNLEKLVSNRSKVVKLNVKMQTEMYNASSSSDLSSSPEDSSVIIVTSDNSKSKSSIRSLFGSKQLSFKKQIQKEFTDILSLEKNLKLVILDDTYSSLGIQSFADKIKFSASSGQYLFSKNSSYLYSEENLSLLFLLNLNENYLRKLNQQNPVVYRTGSAIKTLFITEFNVPTSIYLNLRGTDPVRFLAKLEDRPAKLSSFDATNLGMANLNEVQGLKSLLKKDQICFKLKLALRAKLQEEFKPSYDCQYSLEASSFADTNNNNYLFINNPLIRVLHSFECHGLVSSNLLIKSKRYISKYFGTFPESMLHQWVSESLTKTAITSTNLNTELNSTNLQQAFDRPVLSNNLYCFSHRHVWDDDQEKNWRRFTLYFYPPKCYVAKTIPVYQHRTYDEIFNFDDYLPRYTNSFAESDIYRKGWSETKRQTHDSILKQIEGMNVNTAFSGAGIIQKLLNEFNFHELKKMNKQNQILLFDFNKHVKRLKKIMDPRSLKDRLNYYKACQSRDQAIRRTKLIRRFTLNSNNSLNQISDMILTVLPVLPPDLRPIVKTNGKQAVADLNTFYKNIIYRNERLKKFLNDPALNSSFEMKYAQRLVQEAVDNLIQNGKGGVTPVKDARGRLLKSLSESLKGKQGRFRQYLLGKRVDYSARSVIVVGPRLKLHECGIPKDIAITLYFPFLIKRILNEKLALTVPGAKGLIEKKSPLIWKLLREIMRTRPVLLNRAPTLHRLGFQAFQPKLVEGKAILLHPLVCPAFNADFDGDQMAVHIPITSEANAEAWKLMLSRNNLLSPATGEPLILPSQDMVLGCYYLTTNCAERLMKFQRGTGAYFPSFNAVIKAYQQQAIDLHAIIWVNTTNLRFNSTHLEQPLEMRINLESALGIEQKIPIQENAKLSSNLTTSLNLKNIDDSTTKFKYLFKLNARTKLDNYLVDNLNQQSYSPLMRISDSSKEAPRYASHVAEDQQAKPAKLSFSGSSVIIIYSKSHQFFDFVGNLTTQIIRTTPGKIEFNKIIEKALTKRPKLLNSSY